MEIDGNKYRTIAGIKDGNLVTSKWTVCTGKNLGRSNATTGEQQAQLEVDAKVVKKKEKGYTDDPTKVDEAAVFKPMTAKKYEDYASRLVYPCLSQPKLDGIRCRIDATGAWSRQNKPFLTVPHIQQSLAGLTAKGMIFDGELYNHELHDDFDAIVSTIKRGNPTPVNLAKSLKLIQYWIYDIVDYELTCRERIAKLQSYIGTSHIIICPTHVIEDSGELTARYDRYLEQGYEGQMIRNPDAMYQQKRTYDLLKRKEFMDEEFLVVDIEEGVGNRSGMAGTIIVKLHKPTTEGVETCRCGIKGGYAFYKRIWKERDQIIGKKWATVEFFNYTKKGSLRFPKVKAIRDYE